MYPVDKTQLTEPEVRVVFDTLIEPQLKWSLNALNLVKRVHIENLSVEIDLNVLTRDQEAVRALRAEVEAAVRALGAERVSVRIHHVNVATEGIAGIQHIILVGSGKGGVGKSLVAVNLAAALQTLGKTVGLMDADIYGPSIPTMLGVTTKPEVLPHDHLMPVEAHDMKTMSVGYLIDGDHALDWRGNLASATVLQFFRKTFWGKLDYLVVDLPPGTGDIPLTIAHQIKGDGIVMVTTPQELACCDVRRAMTLYQDRDIPLLGLVENMSFLVCEKCSHTNLPFPSSELGLDGIARLARIPIHRAMSEAADEGIPFMLQTPSHSLQGVFLGIAQKINRQLSRRSQMKQVDHPQPVCGCA